MTLLGSHIAVVVLGDIGRSPRMQHHALALANAGATVHLIGLAGTPPLDEIIANPQIRVHALRDTPLHRDRRGLWLRAAARLAMQTIYLERVLFAIPKLDLILVQNPPAVPTLVAAMFAARLRAAAWVIDWHNLGAAMVALATTHEHPAARLVSVYERLLGQRAAAHLCVSQALSDDLQKRCRISAQVVYDRPTIRFVSLPAAERDEFRRRLLNEIGIGPGEVALIASPTSWTADEDFTLLLEALTGVEAAAAAQPAFPRLVVVASGRGPGREEFERCVRALGLKRVVVHTTFLPHADYARLLAVADLGLCLHRSASGLDLPMKIADMIGAGLPVCALDYGPCLREILSEVHLFSHAAGLARLLLEVFSAFPAERSRLDHLRINPATEHGWREEWNQKALPVIEGVLRRR